MKQGRRFGDFPELTRNRQVGQRELGPHESFTLVSPYSSVSKPRGDSPNGDPDAKRACAWSYERPGGKPRFFAALHVGGITGPREAVRAAIVAEARRKQ